MKDSLVPENFDLGLLLKKCEGLKGVGLAEQLKKDFGRHSGFLGEQIKLNSRAIGKLPTFSKCSCLYTTKSLEQASSEALADFKSRRFSGNLLLDLTGGLGVDDVSFSKTFKKVISLDIDAELNEIARYNFEKLGITNIERIDSEAYEFIKNGGKFDFVYIDSDRRTNTRNKRSITLHEAEPSVLKMKDSLFAVSDCILLKLSPLIDLTYLAKTLPETEWIYVVSLNNEVKEILALLRKSFIGVTSITAVDIAKDGQETEFSGKLNEKNDNSYSGKCRYFYEPAAALIKSGLAAKYAVSNDLMPVGKNSIYQAADKLADKYFGRKFEVVAAFGFSKSRVKKYLDDNKIEFANISKRDFPLTPAELSKLFKLKDGGDDYLFFTRSVDGEKMFFHTRKISNTAAVPSRKKNL